MRSLLVLASVLVLSLACGGGGTVQAPDAPLQDTSLEKPTPVPTVDDAERTRLRQRLVVALIHAPDTGEAQISQEQQDAAETAADAFLKANPEAIHDGEWIEDRVNAMHEDLPTAWEAVREARRPKEPMQVEVGSRPWRILLPYAHYWNTSEDWALYTNDMLMAAEKVGVDSDNLEPGIAEIVVMHEGKEVGRVEVPEEERKLGAQGYLLAMEGKPVLLLEYIPAPMLYPRATEYFGKTFQ